MFKSDVKPKQINIMNHLEGDKSINRLWLVSISDEGSLPEIELSGASQLASTYFTLFHRSVGLHVLYTEIKYRPTYSAAHKICTLRGRTSSLSQITQYKITNYRQVPSCIDRH